MVAMHNKGVAPLIPDRSSQIKSKQDEIWAIFLFVQNPYFADRCMDWLSLNMATDALIFASAALWIDLPDNQKRRGGDLWLKLITVNTRRGYDDMRFSSGAIDFDWSIDQGGGSRRIDHSPPWLVTGKQDQGLFSDLCPEVKKGPFLSILTFIRWKQW